MLVKVLLSVKHTDRAVKNTYRCRNQIRTENMSKNRTENTLLWKKTCLLFLDKNNLANKTIHYVILRDLVIL